MNIPRIPFVVDLSHHDEDSGGVDFNAIKDAGVQAVILKATEGMTFTDKTYRDHVTRARSVDLLVGAYHFLHGGNPEGEMQRFVDFTGADVFHMVDWEHVDPKLGRTATLAEAAAATHWLHDHLEGHWPIVYGSDLLVEAYQAGRFRGLDLLVARYSSQQPAIPWKLWQYQAGELPETIVNRFGGHAHDASTFNGSPEECATWLQSLR